MQKLGEFSKIQDELCLRKWQKTKSRLTYGTPCIIKLCNVTNITTPQVTSPPARWRRRTARSGGRRAGGRSSPARPRCSGGWRGTRGTSCSHQIVTSHVTIALSSLQASLSTAGQCNGQTKASAMYPAPGPGLSALRCPLNCPSTLLQHSSSA